MRRLYSLLSTMIALLVIGVSNASAVDVVIGTGTSTTSSYPAYYLYGGTKTQMLFTPAELTAAGASTGMLNSIAFDFSAVGSIQLQNFTVKVKNTATTNFPNTNFELLGLTTVYTGSITPTTTGWNTIVFNTPFFWNGSSNLLIETAWTNNNGGSNGTNTARYTSTTPNYMCLYKSQDDLASVNDFATTGATRTYNRPNVTLNFTPATFPYYVSNPGLVNLGFTNPGMTSTAKTFTLSGGNLTPAAGNLTLTPSANFQISLDGTTWISNPNTITIPYTGGALAATQCSVRFVSPATATGVDGTVSITGGGVTNPAVATSISLYGSGILTYCSPTYTSTTYADIARFQMNNINNVSQPEAPILSNPAATANTTSYNDYKATVAPINAEVGVPTQYEVSLISSTTSFSTNYLKAYIDLNRDGEIDPVTERVDSLYITSATAVANPVFTRTITIPATAVLGQNTLFRVMISTTAASTPCYAGLTYGETEDYWINLSNPTAMTVNTVTTQQVNKPVLSAGNINEKILRTGVIANGSLSPKTLSSIVFNTQGTVYTGTNPIANAKVYSTGKNGAFSTTTQVGTAIATPSGDMTFTPTTPITLVNGINYFWLVYDVASAAGLDAVIDGQLSGVYTSDAPTTNKIASAQAPAGFAQVCQKKFDGAFSGGVQSMPFDGWTSLNLYGTDTDNYWSYVTAGVNPTNAPHSAPSMAHYNSNLISSGNSAALVSPAFSLSGAGQPTNFSLWLYRHESSASATGSRFMVYMNTQPNLTGATRLVPVGYPTADSINVRYNQGLIPEAAIGWYQYTYNIPATFNTATNYLLFVGASDYYNNIHLDDVTFPTDLEAYMAFNGVDTLNSGNAFAVIGSNNSMVNAFNIKTLSSGNPLSLNSVKITPEGVNNIADVTTAKVWYLGSTAIFDPTTNVLFGSATISSTGQITITRTAGQADLVLGGGNNYFVVSYDIAANAQAGNFVDCRLDAVTYKRGTNVYPEFAVANGNTWGNHELRAPMFGTYQIGGTVPADASRYYPTLSSAVNDLNALGCSADINFQIASDLTETTQVNIGQWTEVGAGGYYLRIYPVGAARTITGPALASANGVITIVGADRVIIDGRLNQTGTSNSLTILNSNTAAGYNVYVFGNATVSSSNNITLRNLNIIGSNKTTSTAAGIYVKNPSGYNIQVLNNNISKAYYGIYSTGLAATTKVSGLAISNNTIGSNDVANQIGMNGIYLVYNEATTISGNEIFGINQSSSSDAVYMGSDVINTMVENNNVHGLVNTGTYRCSAFNVSSVANANITFKNNRIYDIVGNGTGGTSFATAGFYISSGTGINIYNNTVYLTGDRSMTSGTSTEIDTPSGCVVIGSSTVANLDIRNNIFVNNFTMSDDASTGENTCIYTDGAASQFTFNNYNNYYTNNADNFLAYIGATLQTLADLQTATGKDENSSSKVVTFKSATDFHLDGASALDADLLCPAIASVTTDIDGLTRRVAPAMTQMGVDETNPTMEFTQNLVNTNNFYCITNPPAEETLQVGVSVTGFTDGVTRSIVDPIISYTWQMNGITIDDATENTINVLINNENRLGNIYQAYATCLQNTIASATKTIRVEESIQIVTNPIESQLLCTDKGFIDISAHAIGTIDSYGWEKFNSATTSWQTITGMIGETLRVELNNPSMGAGQYRMIVRGPGHCGEANIYSTVSTISSVEPVSNAVINANKTTNEGNVSYCVEEDVVLTANVTNIHGLITGYQWQVKIGNEWSDIDVSIYPTATTPSFELLNAKVEETASYRLKVLGSNVCDVTETVSNVINVTVYPYVKVLVNPEEQRVCRNTQVVLTQRAEGANQVYQWQKDGIDIPLTDNATADKPVFVINSADFSDNGVYRCKIKLDGCVDNSDGDGFLYTKSALVYVMGDTRIVTQPEDIYANIGGTATLEVKAHATGAPEEYMADYQWYKGTQPLNDNAKYSGTRSSMFKIKNVASDDFADDYHVVVTGLCGAPVVSEDAAILQSTFTIDEQPQSITTCDGETAHYMVTASSNVPNTSFTYEWHFVNAALVDARIDGTSNMIDVVAGTETAGSYYVIVKNTANNSTMKSNAASLTVNDKAEITTQPTATTVAAGATFTLTVEATSTTAMTYQWFRNGVEVDGATAATFNGTEAAAGSYTYTVVITNDCGDVTSLPAIVSVTAGGSMNVEEINGLQVSEVSPNPANTAAMVTLTTSTAKNATINVIDATGRTLMNLFDGSINGSQNIRVNASDLSSGTYFIAITMDGKTITRQLVVTK